LIWSRIFSSSFWLGICAAFATERLRAARIAETARQGRGEEETACRIPCRDRIFWSTGRKMKMLRGQGAFAFGDICLARMGEHMRNKWTQFPKSLMHSINCEADHRALRIMWIIQLIVKPITVLSE
jgi:hypothetical protein